MRFCVYSCLFLLVTLGLTQWGQAAPPCHAVVARTSYSVPSYSQTYHHNYQQFVPVVQAVATVPDFFYSARDFSRDEALLEMARAMREQLNAKSAAPAKASSALKTVSTLEEIFPDLDGPATPHATGIDGLMRQECLRCHDGKNSARMDLRDIKKLSPRQLAQVQIKVQLGQMPPMGPLTESQKKTVDDFVKTALLQ